MSSSGYLKRDLIGNGEIMDQPGTYLAILAALSYSDQEELTPTEIAGLTDFTQGGFHSMSNRVPRNDPAILDARSNPTRFVLTEDGKRIVNELQEKHDLHPSFITEVVENGQQDLDEPAENEPDDDTDDEPDGEDSQKFEFICSICGFGSNKEKNIRRHVTLKEDDAHQGVSGDVVDIVDRNEDAGDAEESPNTDDPGGGDSSEKGRDKNKKESKSSIDKLDSVLGGDRDDDRDADQEESDDREDDQRDPARSAAYQTVMERPSLEWDNGDLDLDELAELDDEGDPIVGALIAVTLDVADHARQDKSSSHQRAEIRAKELEAMAEGVKAVTDARRERRKADRE